MANPNASIAQTAGRIDSDIETVKRMTEHVESIQRRIIRNARSLGYFEPVDKAESAPTPVVTTLADALRKLDSAIENASGALNVFD